MNARKASKADEILLAWFSATDLQTSRQCQHRTLIGDTKWLGAFEQWLIARRPRRRSLTMARAPHHNRD